MYAIGPFKIIGIALRTSNANNKASEDLGALWERFFVEQIGEKISGKVSEEIFAIYTDYETDYTGEYTCLIGYEVNNLNKIAEGLVGREFDGGKYNKFVAKGIMPEAVVNSWKEIWAKDGELNRKYSADFEIYGPKCQLGDASEVEIFIAVK
ncbi:GyrI-like domain-containing protein [Algoriphagus resistens]|uniref:GyrI-like domain-containing protein n=1 Tax=Algoriphagus resistens TaxID=1750590 RepID=UPI00071681E3|nr:GyrI-like domain-containing protein [Algoriphagus resistens]